MTNTSSKNFGICKLFILFLATISIAFPQKRIDINFAVEIDTIKDFLGGNKGNGEPTSYLHEIGDRYIRTHDFHGASDYCFYSAFWNTDSAGHFTTINTSFDPDNPLDYYWTETDTQLMRIISNGFEIYFRIGTSYPNPMFPMSTFEPPMDSYSDSLEFTRFAQLCKRTAMHYKSGWDDGFFYDIKYFEIWNEPGGIFWDGSPIQYYKMFQAVSDSLKSYDPSIMVGGPGAVPTTTIGLNPQYRERFLRFLDSTGTTIDFYSWHIYGAKNPYCLKEYADTIRTLLDINGFVDAEIHISEINSNLDSTLESLIPSPQGAAYYLSLVLTALESPIDILLWYPTKIFIIGETQYTQSANAMIAFHIMQNETPIIVRSFGNETLDGYFDTDTTNFMILSAKSEDEKKLYILISNYNSSNTNYEINITSLPWSASDNIQVKRNFIIDSLNFSETTDTIAGGDSLTIYQADMAAPSVLFVRLEKISSTGIKEQQRENMDMLNISPNPFNSSCVISVAPEGAWGKRAQVEILDVRGNVVYAHDIGANSVRPTEYAPTNHTFIWTPDKSIVSGIYLVRAKTPAGHLISKRIVYIK